MHHPAVTISDGGMTATHSGSCAKCVVATGTALLGNYFRDGRRYYPSLALNSSEKLKFILFRLLRINGRCDIAVAVERPARG